MSGRHRRRETLKETDLYAPVKAYLEGQGYAVKAEVAGADVMAMRGDDPDPVIVEMKTAMSLQLIQQGIDRLGVTDFVYLAVPAVKGRKTLARHVALCRRLGLGLLTVRLRDGYVEAQCDPGPYAPRKVKARQGRLLREFSKRQGDPNTGGSRAGIVTAYRQDALRCAAHLALAGACRGAEVARAAAVPRATQIMRDDHYGWFERVEKGVYALRPEGRDALEAQAASGA
ncbi:DUF2161 domain-containing phosphodiesterase [Pseudooceanicola sp. CBS1P-1]|uniref:DUF2161 domain-containing phosphodiesterase n=1 Tax=Pseudooceanicola albus TaxID=2692189 RepID=A0A6L7G7Z4_9RHOB|nr:MULTISPECIES: DUF2161 domain-containing phosphodiesterase [Pseudooceanicola]MBT9382931.1 DUF2161 domain-containing phosphodiesterase [Pseudooceanicola endophyticus]MXN20145.1 hypothetical protein [Pseudooceanicola albus]